jgi:hypothetical protein
MTQATGAFQPSITSGALNNAVYPSVTFNGSSQYMSASSGFSNLSAGASLFIVLNSTVRLPREISAPLATLLTAMPFLLKTSARRPLCQSTTAAQAAL